MDTLETRFSYWTAIHCYDDEDDENDEDDDDDGTQISDKFTFQEVFNTLHASTEILTE